MICSSNFNWCEKSYNLILYSLITFVKQAGSGSESGSEIIPQSRIRIRKKNNSGSTTLISMAGNQENRDLVAMTENLTGKLWQDGPDSIAMKESFDVNEKTANKCEKRKNWWNSAQNRMSGINVGECHIEPNLVQSTHRPYGTAKIFFFLTFMVSIFLSFEYACLKISKIIKFSMRFLASTSPSSPLTGAILLDLQSEKKNKKKWN